MQLKNVAQIPKVTAAPDVTIPLVTVTATQAVDEPAKKRLNVFDICCDF
jgi:hypothetical protein